MTFFDVLITFLVLGSIIIAIYSTIKQQSLKETMDEIKELVQPIDVEPGIMP